MFFDKLHEDKKYGNVLKRLFRFINLKFMDLFIKEFKQFYILFPGFIDLNNSGDFKCEKCNLRLSIELNFSIF